MRGRAQTQQLTVRADSGLGMDAQSIACVCDLAIRLFSLAQLSLSHPQATHDFTFDNWPVRL